jgi:uncharacterized LabA/DUF88 family protein
MSNQVMVFIDYQNVTTTAFECFPRTAASRRFTHIDPIRFAELVVSRRRFPSELVGIRVYRGRPEPRRQPGLAAASDAQTAVWERDPRVTVVRRPLRYPKGYPIERPQEKGIDVALAVDFVRLSIAGAYDVGIIASHDTDLMPALEMVSDLSLAHVEVSGWARRNRLSFPGTKLPWHHSLGEGDYQQVCDDTDYLKDR